VANKRLQHGDIDAAVRLPASAAEVAGLDAEMLGEPAAPLVGQGFPVDEHQPQPTD
jgi:hypothetical protein